MLMMMKVGDDDGYLVMKVILLWKLYNDDSYLVMKVIIVEGSVEFACGNVSKQMMEVQNCKK